MYQALVRITKDDRTATDAPLEAPRFDWAALLDSLLRRMREVHTDASQTSKDAR